MPNRSTKLQPTVSVVGGSTAFDWVRYASPTNCYAPTEVLVNGSYAATDTAVLLAAALVLLLARQVLFALESAETRGRDLYRSTAVCVV